MNKIKTLITLLFIGMFATFAGFASDTNVLSLSDIDVGAQVGYESTYVFRGQEVADDVLVASVRADYNKVYLAVDSYWGLNDDFGTEVDLTGGILVEDILFEGTFVDAGVIGYFYDSNVSVDTVEFYVGVGTDLRIVDLDGYVYYDVDREALTLIGSATNTLQLTENAPLFGKVFLVTTGRIGFVKDNGGLTFDAEDYEYGFASVSSDLVVSVKDVQLSVGARYNFSDDIDANDIDDFSWGAAVGYTF
jgi:hypothetical protein